MVQTRSVLFGPVPADLPELGNWFGFFDAAVVFVRSQNQLTMQSTMTADMAATTAQPKVEHILEMKAEKKLSISEGIMLFSFLMQSLA